MNYQKPKRRELKRIKEEQTQLGKEKNLTNIN